MARYRLRDTFVKAAQGHEGCLGVVGRRPIFGVRRVVRRSFLATWCAALLLTGAPWQAQAQIPTNEELDEARLWLGANPPDGTNRPARRQRMDVIQQAADAFPASSATPYYLAWEADPAQADAMESNGILYYFSRAVDAALADIRNTRVDSGLAVWNIYNMGHIFKTPDACFAIDLLARDAQIFEPDLDFLLTTHEHEDHHYPLLTEAMIAAGKPVVTSWVPGSILVDPAADPTAHPEFFFGDIRVKVDIGDHNEAIPEMRNNMLMYQVDCGAAALGATLYHSGDGSNEYKMVPDEDVDLFMVHVSCAMAPESAIAQVQPDYTFISHVLELNHEIGVNRLSYDYAFSTIANTPVDEAAVLTWGERWLLPGTVITMIPEPATFTILGLGGLVLLLRRGR